MQSSPLFSLATASFFHNYIGESMKNSLIIVLQECLLGLLGSKTIIYVTHQVEFLPAADIIVVSYSHLVSSTYRGDNRADRLFKLGLKT